MQTDDGPAGFCDGPCGRSSGPVLTATQIDDFVVCPLMFAFKHVYKVRDTRPPTVQELWGKVLGELFVWIHLQLLQFKSVAWGDLLTEWERQWGAASKAAGGDLGELTRARNRGARHVREMFDAIDSDMGVLGVRYPCQRTIDSFLVTHDIPVIKILDDQSKSREGREIQIINVDPVASKTPSSFELCRSFSQFISTYGLETDIRHSFRQVARKVSSWLYLPRIPKVMHITTDDRVGHQVLRWTHWILESISNGYFYPRAGAHCSGCYYQPACDLRYVSSKRLADPHTADDVRSKICQTCK